MIDRETAPELELTPAKIASVEIYAKAALHPITNIATFCAAVCSTTALSVIIAAQKRLCRLPAWSTTLPQHKPARHPPIKTALVWRPVVAELRWK